VLQIAKSQNLGTKKQKQRKCRFCFIISLDNRSAKS